MSENEGVTAIDDLDLEPAPPRRRRRWPWVIVFSIVGLLVAGTVAVGAYAWHLSTLFQQAEVIPSASAFPTQRPADTVPDDVNVLLVGSDSREGLGSALDAVRDQRSDTILLVHIPRDRKGVQVVSFMRDNWVDIPGHGPDKINAALAIGGMPLLVQTIESIVKVPIDHVAITDFQGIKGISTALGGVTVENQVAFSVDGFDYPQGTITLSGEQALNYVRERHPFADADYQRVRNQQAFLKGVALKVMSRETLTDPGKLAAVVGAMSKYTMVDSTLTPETLAPIAFSLRDVRPQDILFLTSPTLGTGTSDDGQSIVLPDWDKLALLAQAFQNDTVPAYAAANG